MLNLRHPDFTPAQLARGKKMWEGTERTEDIMRVFGFTHRRQLYSLRRWQGWRTRNPDGIGRPQLVFTYTRREEQRARKKWIAGGSLRELMAILHLSSRGQVYIVRDKEHWPERNHFQNGARASRYAWPSEEFKREIREALPDFRDRRKLDKQHDTGALAHTCPGCGYRVIAGPEYGALSIGGELFHEHCAPKAA